MALWLSLRLHRRDIPFEEKRQQKRVGVGWGCAKLRQNPELVRRKKGSEAHSLTKSHRSEPDKKSLGKSQSRCAVVDTCLWTWPLGTSAGVACAGGKKAALGRGGRGQGLGPRLLTQHLGSLRLNLQGLVE